ncbi:MAG: glycosyl hydrolase, partial [Opitutales bacterium]
MKVASFFSLIRLLCLVLSLLPVLRADRLQELFADPPESTKPWCYWYWLNGDITKEGITRDLEA